MRRWLIRFLVAGLIVGALAMIFRQGVLPAHLTPLPRLDLARPLPLVVDWQLAELRYDRRLCQETIASRDGERALINARRVADRPLKNGCGWINAVGVRKVGSADLSVGQVTCQVAAALALWAEYVVQPEAQRIFGQRVQSIEDLGTYSCRNIVGNSLWRDRRSEHATANAIDISAFRLVNGETISVLRDWKGDGKKAEFLRAVHQGACRYFRVALSPDFNAAHRDHFHFDRGILWRCW